MTPQALLRETERAAGDDRLTSWHDTLINAGKERKELSEVLWCTFRIAHVNLILFIVARCGPEAA